MKSRGIFIIGTDTDVGKTYISAILMKKLIDKNINATYYKAVLSGAIEESDNLIPGDAKYVCEISGLDEKYENIASYSLKNPVSPHLAANIENIDIKFEKIKNDFENLYKKYDFILAEGSGGIICPIKIKDDETLMLEDIVKMTGFEIILVARSSVGTINHTFLTVKYLKSKNFKIKGIILNEFDRENIAHLDNAKTIELLTGVKIIAYVPKMYKASQEIDIDINYVLS
ncbi:dethiobiotin synthase [Paraclostridium sordellii]|uniref:dethiobiotin synthase n=1 Tax=Paraclostridium sordellii TaxID=1505 RepID=UPI0003855D5D|nr:dethiobiotin synthase [Paeniclostridium sordellii]EPZ57587.1 dethiobiotin synthase [[Clostridium] sordellii VPI 9048] [Paeniclostridium sordellii VPI 9048]CEK37849.1 putative dethiobiotin synthetase [[Clostridium] sordellii] [Paeniclostridium sordellii]